MVIFGAGAIGQIIAKLSIYFKSNHVYLVDKNQFKLKNGIKDKNLSKLNFDQLNKEIKKKNKISRIKFIFVACSSLNAQRQAIDLAEIIRALTLWTKKRLRPFAINQYKQNTL